MARKKRPEPTDAELRILRPLWEHGPLRLSEICESLSHSDQPPATTTVATVLRVMSEKGLVKRRTRKGQVLWEALEDHSATSSRFLDGIANRLFEGSTRKLISHLIEEGDLTEKDRQEIRRMLSQREGEK